MSELRVKVTGDAAGFNATLNQAKKDAAAFNASLVQQSKQAQMASQMEQRRISGARKLGEAGARIGSIANAAGVIPGLDKIAGPMAGAAAVFLSLKEVASGLKMKMGMLAANIGMFAAAAIAAKLITDKAGEAMKALAEETASQARSILLERKVRESYDKAVDDARRKFLITDKEARGLKADLRSQDRDTMLNAQETIRNRFGNPETNAKLDAMIASQKIENMPEGPEKEIAKEKVRAQKERDKLREVIGGDAGSLFQFAGEGKQSVETQARVRQLFSMINEESNRNIEKILQTQLEEQRKISRNTDQRQNNPFR